MKCLNAYKPPVMAWFLFVMMWSAHAQELCVINGPAGTCQVRVSAIAMRDAGCRPWVNALFWGTCQNGRLEGPALIKRPQPDGKKLSYYLANFRQGEPDEPVVSYFNEGIFVSLRNSTFADCVWFDDSGAIAEDFRTKRKLCIQATTIFGSEILSNATYQAIRSDQFNVGSVVFSAQIMADDPKTVGRGAALR